MMLSLPCMCGECVTSQFIHVTKEKEKLRPMSPAESEEKWDPNKITDSRLNRLLKNKLLV